MSEEGFNKSKTPLTGSSEDINFHFHQSTSPSDRSSFSEESGEVSNTNQSFIDLMSSQTRCERISRDKNISFEVKTNRSIDFSEPDSFKNGGGVTWVSGMVCGKSDNMSNIQQVSHHKMSQEVDDTSNDFTFIGSKSSMKNITYHREKVNKTDIFSESRNFSDVLDMGFNDKHADAMTSDTQVDLEDFVALADNCDAEQNCFKKTDPLKYCLKYKNLDLQVLDSSESITIRLVDEEGDCNPSLRPTWKRFVNSSLSSSNSSINLLELPSAMSSNSSGETIKANVNISEGELLMQVGESDLEDKAHENLKTASSENSNKINKTVNSNDIQMLAQRHSDNINQNSNGENESLMSDKPKTTHICVTNDELYYEYPTNDDNLVSETNPETVINETKILTNSSGDKDYINFNKQYFEEGENIKLDTSTACNTKVEECGVSKDCLLETETGIAEKNECVKDFQFNAKGIKLTCKPSSESESVEVKFRKLNDKTKLTFKSGHKKLYLKMSPRI